MRSARLVRSLRLAPLASSMALLAACANPGSVKPTATVTALYAQLDQATQGYETALQQVRAGNDAAGQQTLNQAIDTVKNASVHCGSTPGCDPQRFFSAYDRMLRLKDGSFIGDENADGDPQTGMALDQHGPAALPEAQRSVILLHGQKLSELIAMNGAVKAALQMWLTQWRPNLIDAWISYQYMRSEMWPAYQKADLPEALLFGIMAKESGGKVHAVSRSGAAGPLQFMYATGMRFGLTTDDGFDLRFDPAASARANAEYMDEQLKVFNDNLELTIAAYNTGEGRMSRLVGDDTKVSFYDPRIYNQLSQETRDYVPSVLAAAWLFLHPDSYNLRFPKIDGEPGSITLKRPASLSELTVCLGSAGGMEEGWFRTLRNLNPRLDPQQEQPAGVVLQVPKLLEQPYAARCVDGPWPILAGDLHAAAAPVVADPLAPARAAGAVRTRSYKVRRGDTLVGIVRQLRCSSVQEVAEMNHLRHQHITVGQVLTVPECR
ncbi:transglycosylase SLT domain-containing protein [Rhodanobacter sp. 7MK24]|uniref:transglycosylase SLT domain-containing protein n=1 Tax=Rhodanobacter sp. 7MK24 TaxID=2775922 RepID=UPI00177FF902|nr:transglycosylase SLT domain-containing protein [Rhodanobacter sp. 7MK24]MBD8881026.1 transglycosylase SLT domain-containing protein [Rhodanobacter sp. 7MK24]